MVSVTIKPTDPRLIAIKAELLHGIPELTGKQINQAAFIALAAIDRLSEDSKTEIISTLVPRWQ